ncbi:MAG TPA: flagellar biosynthesis anti-sigma factor FlgM [Acidiferrobacterales bacterium]|nr:flagellar biosynthesis anti-sigma factor FlgM [Acidiferrobacterales bacterium]
MPTDINGFRPRTLDTNDSKSTTRSGPPTGRAAPAASPTGQTATSSDSVNLTDTATRLQQLDELLAGAPEIDRARVEQLRQSIADGRYKMDAVHVADKLIALERTLFGTDKG